MATTASARSTVDGSIEVISVEELQRRGVVTHSAAGIALAVFWHEDKPFAVDNRCPHMGFPLSRGSCKNGILTCKWHYARFDLESGGTFDPFAGDLTVYPAFVRNGKVFVDLSGREEPAVRREKQLARLKQSLEQEIRLVSAKAVLALMNEEEPGTVRSVVWASARHGISRGSRRNPQGWGDGMTILTAMANILDHLRVTDRRLALYHGARRVAEDTAGQIARWELEPLPPGAVSKDRLKQWFREFIEARNDQGAERILRRAAADDWTQRELLDMLAAASTDHYYRDFSHVIDSLNKAAELLDLVGWDRADSVLSSLLNQLATSTREEERNEWFHPEDLREIVEAAVAELPEAFGGESDDRDYWEDSLIEALLGDDPVTSVRAILSAGRAGCSIAAAARAVAYASVLRLARFSTSNEFGDWNTAFHHFSQCVSLAQVARRAPSLELARGILHGAMLVYQSRFLNVPPARLPSARQLDALPADAPTILKDLDYQFERQGGVDEAGALTYRYLSLGHDPAELIGALGSAVLREDPAFHDFQMLEQCVKLHQELRVAGQIEAAAQALVALARWQAAHSPTRRETTQTYDIALRLHRGEAIYAEAER